MPRVKKAKIEEPKVETPVVPEEVEEKVIEPKVENPNVKVVELNGRKYNQIFNPLDGTTKMEPLVE